tara:strand:- start:184 stop:1302 length:1119 start_codon:yes stop_codon:yes gene_type:complete
MFFFQQSYFSTFQKLFVSLLLCFSYLASTSTEASSKLAIESNTPRVSNVLPSSYFYLGGKVGLNHYQHGCEAWNIDCDKNSIAAGLFAGYQFNDNFAFETEYIDLGKAEATYIEAVNKHTYQGTMKGLNLSAVGSLYLLENLALFGKAGVFNWYGENKGPFSTIKADDWAPTVGAGVSYQINDSWQARFEYQYFHHLGNDTIGGSNAHLTSIGISYQFGRARPTKVTKAIVTETMVIETIVTETIIKAAPIELEEVTFSFLFDFDSSKLLLVDSLAVIVKRLIKHPQATVILRGYSDSKGSNKYNLALSKRRTDSIANYLLTQGIQTAQITSEYYGEKNPVSTLDNDEHRYLNRRVQILLPSVFINTAQEQK